MSKEIYAIAFGALIFGTVAVYTIWKQLSEMHKTQLEIRNALERLARRFGIKPNE